jgi:hypothetical protein
MGERVTILKMLFREVAGAASHLLIETETRVKKELLPKPGCSWVVSITVGRIGRERR